MRKASLRRFALGFLMGLVAFTLSCSNDTKAAPTKAEITLEPGVYTPDHPEIFKLVSIESRELSAVLTANGSVTPDVNRTIHVTSQGSGRVVDLKVKLGDFVAKGQTLLSIYSADLGGAFSDYQKSVADERLARKGLDRAQLLYSRGALAQKDLEAAQDAEDKAVVDVQTNEHRVTLLGGDPAHPGSLIELRAPVAGTIVEQNVSGFEGVKSLDNSPNLFTIADLSQVWIVCDVYENDLREVQVGDSAEICLNAYPDKVLSGKISDISRVLDPNLRSAKVRVVLSNPDGYLRPGMYATATFRSRKLRDRLVVPSTAIMRLQDKDWVFRKESANKFRQIEVHTEASTESGLQQLQDGSVKAGDQVVADALQFSSAMAENK